MKIEIKEPNKQKQNNTTIKETLSFKDLSSNNENETINKRVHKHATKRMAAMHGGSGFTIVQPRPNLSRTKKFLTQRISQRIEYEEYQPDEMMSRKVNSLSNNTSFPSNLSSSGNQQINHFFRGRTHKTTKHLTYKIGNNRSQTVPNIPNDELENNFENNMNMNQNVSISIPPSPIKTSNEIIQENNVVEVHEEMQQNVDIGMNQNNDINQNNQVENKEENQMNQIPQQTQTFNQSVPASSPAVKTCRTFGFRKKE